MPKETLDVVTCTVKNRFDWGVFWWCRVEESQERRAIQFTPRQSEDIGAGDKVRVVVVPNSNTKYGPQWKCLQIVEIVPRPLCAAEDDDKLKALCDTFRLPSDAPWCNTSFEYFISCAAGDQLPKTKELKKSWMVQTDKQKGKTKQVLSVRDALRVFAASPDILCAWLVDFPEPVISMVKIMFDGHHRLPRGASTVASGRILDRFASVGHHLGQLVAHNPYLIWTRLSLAKMDDTLKKFDALTTDTDKSSSSSSSSSSSAAAPSASSTEHRRIALQFREAKRAAQHHRHTYCAMTFTHNEVRRIEWPWPDMIEDGIYSAVYIASHYRHETRIAEVLSAVRRRQDRPSEYTLLVAPTGKAAMRCQEAINAYLQNPVQLDDEQTRAVEMAMTQSVSYIDGAAGCGKTTTTGSLYSALLAQSSRTSGKRHKTHGQVECCTMHRVFHADVGCLPGMLGCSRTMSVSIVIDEASMIDASTLAAFLWHVHQTATIIRLVFVGDLEQLPPIGAGSVLHDLVRSGVIPSVVLQTVHRQGAECAILHNAHIIRRFKEEGVLCTVGSVLNPKDNFQWTRLPSANTSMEHIVQAVRAHLVADKHVQVIAPYNYLCDQISPMVREFYIPDWESKCIRFPAVVGGGRRAKWQYCIGDRVMSTHNVYFEFTEDAGEGKEETTVKRLAVANGSIGEVKNVGGKGIHVDFPNELGSSSSVEYSFKLTRGATKQMSGGGRYPCTDGGRTQTFWALQPAWVSTVHKFQGSEYPRLIVVLHGNWHRMLTRNMLYTAVTRAKRHCVLVGHANFINACSGTAPIGRMKLAERLRDGTVKK